MDVVEKQKLLSQNQTPPQVSVRQEPRKTQLGPIAECVDMKTKDEQ